MLFAWVMSLFEWVDLNRKMWKHFESSWVNLNQYLGNSLESWADSESIPLKPLELLVGSIQVFEILPGSWADSNQGNRANAQKGQRNLVKAQKGQRNWEKAQRKVNELSEAPRSSTKSTVDSNNWVMTWFESIFQIVFWVMSRFDSKFWKVFGVVSWFNQNIPEVFWFVSRFESNFRKLFWIVSWFESILVKPLWVMSESNKKLSRTHVCLQQTHSTPQNTATTAISQTIGGSPGTKQYHLYNRTKHFGKTLGSPKCYKM